MTLVMWNLAPFGDSASRDLHGLRRTCHKLGIVWTHPIELLGDMGHVESHFFPFGDSVSVGAKSVHILRQTYHRG